MDSKVTREELKMRKKTYWKKIFAYMAFCCLLGILTLAIAQVIPTAYVVSCGFFAFSIALGLAGLATAPGNKEGK